MIKIPSDHRNRLRAELDSLFKKLADETAAELCSKLKQFPYPELSDRVRAKHLLIREAYKLTNDMQLK